MYVCMCVYVYIYIYVCVCMCVCIVCVCVLRGIGTRHSSNGEAASPLDSTATGIGIVQYYFIQSVIVHLNYLWSNMPSC